LFAGMLTGHCQITVNLPLTRAPDRCACGWTLGRCTPNCNTCTYADANPALLPPPAVKSATPPPPARLSLPLRTTYAL
jgi:hypothetical protein